MAIKLDNRVSLAEAHHAIEASGDRLNKAMADSARNARDAATLSEGEVAAHLNKAGLAGGFEAIDRAVFQTAVKIAQSRNSGQVGASEIQQAVNAWKLASSSASKGDGFLGKLRDTGSEGLKAIYAAGKQHEIYTAANRAKVDADVVPSIPTGQFAQTGMDAIAQTVMQQRG